MYELTAKILTFISAFAVEYYSMAMIAVLLHCFFDEDFAWNKRKKIIILIISTMNTVFLERAFNDVVYSLIQYVIVVAILVYGCKGKYFRKILLAFFAYFMVTMIYSSIMFMGVYYFIPEINFESDIVKLDYRAYGILALFMAFCYYRMTFLYIRKDIHIKLGRKSYVFLIIYTVFIIFMYAMLMMLRDEPELEKSIQNILVIFLIVFCLMVPFYLIKGQVSNYFQHAKEYQEMFLQEQLKAFESYKAAEEETKRMRHDMKNNLTCVAMLLNEGKTNEAAAYVEDLLSEISALSPKVITGDEMLNCIISSKLEWMKRENIDFEIDGVLDKGLDWQPIDICRVFANAIDNAIEACIKMEEDMPRQIQVILKKTKQYYSIEIQNTISGKESCVPVLSKKGSSRYTTKKDKKHHGMGLMSIQKTVEKYGGILNLECDEKVFRLNIVV